jgi:hypothetical protein
VVTDGFGSSSNKGIAALTEFGGQLYAGTAGDSVNGSEIWRSSDGLSWTRVVSQTFGDPNYTEITCMATFSDTLLASTYAYTSVYGAEIWASGDGLSWTRVVTDGLGDSDARSVNSFQVYSDCLYAGARGTSNGGQIWRTCDGVAWSQVNTAGFGDPDNQSVEALESFDGYLYAGLYNYQDSDNPGAELWRCQLCNGTDWQQVPIVKGFGDTENRGIAALLAFENALYAIAGNSATGIEAWRSMDGTNWEQVSIDGLGDSGNQTALDRAVAVFGSSLYVGTVNSYQGGEVWLYLHERVYLSLAVRSH